MQSYNRPGVVPLDLDFLKDRYDAELLRKGQLTDSLGLPVALLTVIGGILGAMASGFSFQFLRWPFVVTLVADCCAFAVCMLFLALAYHRQTYGYLQRLGELERAYETLEGFDLESAPERFERYVRRSIIEAADLNADSNDRRGAYLYRARVALLVVVAVTGILGIFYVVDRSKQPIRIPVVHIDNLDPKGKP